MCLLRHRPQWVQWDLLRSKWTYRVGDSITVLKFQMHHICLGVEWKSHLSFEIHWSKYTVTRLQTNSETNPMHVHWEVSPIVINEISNRKSVFQTEYWICVQDPHILVFDYLFKRFQVVLSLSFLFPYNTCSLASQNAIHGPSFLLWLSFSWREAMEQGSSLQDPQPPLPTKMYLP